MLTGLERFVRLVVERETLVPRSQAGESFAADKNDKSPKVFGVPKPYTGLYSASSYMANRPSYGLRNREPGNYTLNSSHNISNDAPATYNANYKLPGLGGIPGENKNTSLSAGTSSLTTARSSSTLPTSSSSTQNLNNQSFDSMIPDGIRYKVFTQVNIHPYFIFPKFRSKLSVNVTQPSGVTANNPSVVTESITKTTFTETTVKRVTSTAVVEQVSLRRSGGPLGLSIIGGNDHSCVPFGTGEQVSVLAVLPPTSALLIVSFVYFPKVETADLPMDSFPCFCERKSYKNKMSGFRIIINKQF